MEYVHPVDCTRYPRMVNDHALTSPKDVIGFGEPPALSWSPVNRIVDVNIYNSNFSKPFITSHSPDMAYIETSNDKSPSGPEETLASPPFDEFSSANLDLGSAFCSASSNQNYHPSSRTPSPPHAHYHQKRPSLNFNRRTSLFTLASNSSGNLAPATRQQTLGLRTKKFIIPKLLSRRKFALALLPPLSAAVMNDIHYLLKAHVKPKAHFIEVDNVILRTIIKVGIIAQELQEDEDALSQMRLVERIARHFGVTFSDLLGVAEDAPSASPPPDISNLMDLLTRLRMSLLAFVETRLGANSIDRIAMVFEVFESEQLWARIFNVSSSSPQEWQLVRNLRTSFNALIDAGQL